MGTTKRVIEEVRAAVLRWPEFAQQAEIPAPQMAEIQALLLPLALKNTGTDPKIRLGTPVLMFVSGGLKPQKSGGSKWLRKLAAESGGHLWCRILVADSGAHRATNR